MKPTFFRTSQNRHSFTFDARFNVLINLITNAIKYSSKTKTRIEVSLSDKDGFYEFSVEDNSDGIPKKEISKIFDLFSVVGVADKYGNMGTGIGLATVKRLVQDLGGDIHVSSKEGQGSTFTFTIAKILGSRSHLEAESF